MKETDHPPHPSCGPLAPGAKVQELNREFVLLNSESEDLRILRHIGYGYELPIRPGGYAPKSGLFVAKILEEMCVRDKVVFDIGTGETALLAIHAAALGARRVLAIDIDPIAVDWARRCIRGVQYGEVIEVLNEDISVFSPTSVADLIISNPPQMPTAQNSSLHDDGGWDGRDVLISIFKHCQDNLAEGGSLVVSMMEFLGGEKSYSNEYEPLFDIMRRMSLNPVTIASAPKEIARGSYTHGKMSHIRAVYPKYEFGLGASGNPVTRMNIVRGEKVLHPEDF